MNIAEFTKAKILPSFAWLSFISSLLSLLSYGVLYIITEVMGGPMPDVLRSYYGTLKANSFLMGLLLIVSTIILLKFKPEKKIEKLIPYSEDAFKIEQLGTIQEDSKSVIPKKIEPVEEKNFDVFEEDKDKEPLTFDSLITQAVFKGLKCTDLSFTAKLSNNTKIKIGDKEGTLEDFQITFQKHDQDQDEETKQKPQIEIPLTSSEIAFYVGDSKK